jgi:tetratricopeptide (TPR) repeat protein
LATSRRILDLDPSMAEARQLRDQAARQMQQVKVRPRLDALLKSAEQEIGERRFGEALESLESAQRLDQTDDAIRIRLEDVKRLADLSKRAAELVMQAEREFRQRDLAKAQQLCSDALAIDERHPQALHLMQVIHKEEAGREDREKRARLQGELQTVRGLLQEQRFGEAVEQLDRLRLNFGDDPQISEVLAAVGAELRNFVEKNLDRARQLEKAGQWEEALAAINDALARYPHASELAAVRKRLESVISEFTAETAEFDSLLQAEKIEAAAQVLDRNRVLLGNDARLLPLQERLTAAVAARQRRGEIQRLCAEARDHVSRSRFDEAVKLLEGAAVRFPDARDFAPLLAEAEKGKRDALQRQAVEEALAAAAALVEKGQPEPALAALEEKLRLYPDSRELADAASRLRTRVQASARQREIAETTRSIERLMAEKKWAQALAAADAAQQQFPDTPAFAALQRNAEAARRQADIEDVIAAAAEARRQGNLSRAAELLAAGRARYPDEQRLNKLFAATDAAIADESLAHARPLIDAGRFDEAEALVREALARRPKLPAAQELLREIAGRMEERLRQQRLRERAVADTAAARRSPRGLVIGLSVAASVVLIAGAWWKLHTPAQPESAPPAFWPHELRNGVRGEAYMDTLNAHAGSKPLTYSVAKGTLPAGLDLDSGEGVIHGIPTAAGSSSFTAQVTDRDGRSAHHAFTITVTAPEGQNLPAALAVDNAGKQWTAVRGSEFSEFLRASGGSQPVTWSVSKRSLPRGLSLDAKYGHVRGAAAEDGVFPFTARATDHAGHTAEGDFTITVKSKEQPPVTSALAVQDTGVPASAVRAEHYAAALSATGGTGAVTWSAQGLPRGLTLDAATGRIDGALAAEGTFSFVAKATDQTGKSGEHVFTITVKAKDQPPPACQMKPYDFNTYGDLPNGTLTWSGNLANGADLTINGRTATPGAIRGAADYLPNDGAHVAVDVTPPTVKVKEQPSARTCWAPHLVLHNDGPAVSSITIKWRVIP